MGNLNVVFEVKGQQERSCVGIGRQNASYFGQIERTIPIGYTATRCTLADACKRTKPACTEGRGRERKLASVVELVMDGRNTLYFGRLAHVLERMLVRAREEEGGAGGQW